MSMSDVDNSLLFFDDDDVGNNNCHHQHVGGVDEIARLNASVTTDMVGSCRRSSCLSAAATTTSSPVPLCENNDPDDCGGSSTTTVAGGSVPQSPATTSSSGSHNCNGGGCSQSLNCSDSADAVSPKSHRHVIVDADYDDEKGPDDIFIDENRSMMNNYDSDDLPPVEPVKAFFKDSDSGRFPCRVSECDMVFRHRGSLWRHIQQRHFGQRRHVCRICKARFAQKPTLVTHMRIHEGQRPFACLEKSCKKRFTQSSNMKRHWRTAHSNDPHKFTCPIPRCHVDFSTKASMHRHIAKQH